MIRIAICDDEKEDRERIYNFLKSYQSEKSAEYDIRLYEYGEQLLKSGFEPDIVFLDIVMNEMDGIQTGVEIRRKRSDVIIIYITFLNEKMALALNQVHSYGYLVKPVVREELFQILSDAVAQVKRNLKMDTVKFLSENNTLIELSVKDIYYFEYCSRKIKIVARDKTYFYIKEKIGNIAEKMEKYGFFMSHQSFVVNLYYVDRISSQLLYMKNGDKVYLAQKRASAIRRKLIQTAKESINDGGSK